MDFGLTGRRGQKKNYNSNFLRREVFQMLVIYAKRKEENGFANRYICRRSAKIGHSGNFRISNLPLLRSSKAVV